MVCKAATCVRLPTSLPRQHADVAPTSACRRRSDVTLCLHFSVGPTSELVRTRLVGTTFADVDQTLFRRRRVYWEVLGPFERRLLGKNEQRVYLGKPYFNKLLTSVCRQVRRWEQAIWLSTYYTGHVHSILGQNLNGARRRRFGQFFRPYYTLRNFWIFR